MISVPSAYKQYVADAAAATGLPQQVVAAQIQLESNWNPRAKSGAGAEGIAQFMPGTFAEYGPKGGSPYNVADAFKAYVAYMKQLLRQEGGDIRKALEAYNAGPGNLSAGASYASTILQRAGQSGSPTAGAGSSGSGTAQQASFLSALGGWLGMLAGGNTSLSPTAGILGAVFTPVGNFFTDLGHALETWMHAVLWIVNPMNWVRILAGIAGVTAVASGAWIIAGSS